MSKRLVETELQGWRLPRIVPIETLHSVLGEDNFNGGLLHEACTGLPGYESMDRPITDDGYHWFWAVRFRTDRGAIAILIPWFQDWDKKDGSQADRSIAVYTQGTVADAEIAATLANFGEAMAAKFEELARQLRENPPSTSDPDL